MPSRRSSTHVDQRTRLLEVALRQLEQGGPEALQARSLTAEVGASTQAVYTLFGGMPGLFEALVAEGFTRFARHIEAVPETADPVADHFAKGGAYCDWALAHPQLYRLMLGITGGALRAHMGLEATLTDTSATIPEGRAALEVLVRSLERIVRSGRIDPVDPLDVARQFVSATHGYVLLEIGGAFGDRGAGLPTVAALAINLMVGLGDTRAAAEQSLAAATAARSDLPAT